MKGLAVVVLVLSALSPVAAQAPDQTLERIAIALERSRSTVIDSGELRRIMDQQTVGLPAVAPFAGVPKLGPFEFVAPQLRGEFVRLALPVGQYLSQGMRAVTAANRRRQEQAARRRVEKDLKAWRGRSTKH